MNAWILDRNFNKLQLMDGVYESFIWTDRYYEPGDFELVIPLESAYKNNLLIDNYLELENEEDSEHTMIIESRVVTSGPDGKHLKISGRSFESVLDRRIIWIRRTYNLSSNAKIYDIAHTLMDDNVINPTSASSVPGDATDAAKRKLPIIFDTDVPDKIKNYVIHDDTEYYDSNMLDAIETMCKDKKYNLGFKLIRDRKQIVTPSSPAIFKFSLYKGKDLTRDNTEGNEPVYFSPNFDNLLNSTYLESKASLKNFSRISNGSGDSSVTAFYPATPEARSDSGLDRREIVLNPSTSSDTNVTAAYLQTKGQEELQDYDVTKTFEGELLDKMFILGKDYKMGDIVQFENEFGDKDKTRIVEIIFSSERDGERMYPTLESTRDDKE